MSQYVCSICGYIYDEVKGIPEAGIASNTKWEDLPKDWKCPLCGAPKSAFKKDEKLPRDSKAELEAPEVLKELSAMEMSVICSNLSKGCEKQYQEEQAEGFRKLAEFFQTKAEQENVLETEKLADLITKDLENIYPYANEISGEMKDRGALRSLVWSEKVTRMLSALLDRFEKEGDAMLTNTGVYVCTVCGFVYVGDSAPKLCPVCKVPSWKFEKIEGGVVS